MSTHRILIALILFAALPALAQQCPQSNGPSEVRTLEGKLVYHDGLRQWFELNLDQPECGQPSTELILLATDRTPLQILRGCRVRSTGPIALSPTGYFSLDTFQNLLTVEPVGPCTRQPPIPIDPVAKPGKSIRKYRVDMHVFNDGDHPVQFRVTSAGKELHPWQAYARYYFTGGQVLYGYCSNGFVTDKVFGTPQANPSHFEEPRTPDDSALFDPYGAAESGVKDLHLSYTCIRNKSATRNQP